MLQRFDCPRLRLGIVYFLIFCLFFTGCAQSDTPKKTSSLDYTVVAGTDIPEELQDLILKRQDNAFELTFSDNGCLYIIKGYGKQSSGGYSIVINDFYQSDDSLVFDTELFGPKKEEAVSSSPSYPYIVIKTEYRENPVIFR
jgi:hypothetical protein